jgi:hypothetical protein
VPAALALALTNHVKQSDITALRLPQLFEANVADDGEVGPQHQAA